MALSKGLYGQNSAYNAEELRHLLTIVLSAGVTSSDGLAVSIGSGNTKIEVAPGTVVMDTARSTYSPRFAMHNSAVYEAVDVDTASPSWAPASGGTSRVDVVYAHVHDQNLDGGAADFSAVYFKKGTPVGGTTATAPSLGLSDAHYVLAHVYSYDAGATIEVTDMRMPTEVTGGSPIGTVQSYAGTGAPFGWLQCAGQTVSRTFYARLFAAIGTTFGVGDGSSTFALPDMRGRAAIGAGQGVDLTNRTHGTSFGAESFTLDTTNLPSHSHTGSTGLAGSHAHGPYGGGQGFVTTNVVGGAGYQGSTYANDAVLTTDVAPHHQHSVTINNTGGGAAKTHMPPAIALNYIIKAG